MHYTESQLMTERSRHESWLNQQQEVMGTGIGLDHGGNPCIKIYTSHTSEATKNAILARLGYLPVEFEETGEFRAF